jgi:hypothetical protein
VQTYDRRRRAAELRRAGHTWDEIAAECGFASQGSAYNAVKRLMEEARDLAYGEADLYRAETIQRYEAVIRAAWPFMEAGSDKHMNVILRTCRQISELRGEFAPVQIQIGEGDVDRALRELNDELNRRAAAAQGEAGGSAPAAHPDSRG